MPNLNFKRKFFELKNIAHIIQSIKDYKGFKTNAGLAEFLGISRSAISNWITRGYIDENLILEKIPEITLKFLRTGEYPMTEQHNVIGNLLKRIEHLERRIERLEKNGKDK